MQRSLKLKPYMFLIAIWILGSMACIVNPFRDLCSASHCCFDLLQAFSSRAARIACSQQPHINLLFNLISFSPSFAIGGGGEHRAGPFWLAQS
jgi:hypothetical protein